MPTKAQRREQIRARMSAEARLLLDEYDRACAALRSSSAVQAALELTDEDHYELAAWRATGAERVVARRNRGAVT